MTHYRRTRRQLAKDAALLALGATVACPSTTTTTGRAGVTGVGTGADAGTCPSASSFTSPLSALYVDAHCHSFNAHDVPIDGFIERFAAGYGAVPDFIVKLKFVQQFIEAFCGVVWQNTPSDEGASLTTRALVRDVRLPVPDVDTALRTTAEEFRTGFDDRFSARPLLKSELRTRTLTDEQAASLLLSDEAARDPAVARWMRTNGVEPRPLLEPAPAPGPPRVHEDVDKLLAPAPPSTMSVRGLLQLVVDALKKATPWAKDIMSSRAQIVGRLIDESVIRDRAGNVLGGVTLFLPALVDFDVFAAGKRSHKMPREQVVMQEQIARDAWAGKLGSARRRASVHGYVGFNPLKESRSDARYRQPGLTDADFAQWDAQPPSTSSSGSFDVVRDAIMGRGFVGVKLYPDNGFQPWGNAALASHPTLSVDERRAMDAALQRLYRWCDEQSVPLLVHTGSFNRFDEAFHDYAFPRHWQTVLANYPRLRVCLGHFGIEDQMQDGTYWLDDAATLALQTAPHGRVFFDVSDQSSPLPEDADDTTLHRLRRLHDALARHDANDDLRRRLLYGTDYFMNEIPGPMTCYLANLDQQVTSDAAFALGGDFHDQFFGKNALVFLGIAHDDGTLVSADDAGNRKRLLAWYGADKPAWLG